MKTLGRHTDTPAVARNSGLINHDGKKASTISDQEFLGELEKHKDAFHRFVKRTVSNKSSVDDTFSSAVLTAYERRHTFARGTSFRAWMFYILVNQCYEANRESERSLQDLDAFNAVEAPSDLNAPWKSFYDLDDFLEECGDEVHSALHRLSFVQRVCLLLRLVEQLSYREIAEVLEIPLREVSKHLARGRKRMRAELSEYARRQHVVLPNSRRIDARNTTVLAHN